MYVNSIRGVGRVFVNMISAATLVMPCQQAFAADHDIPTGLPVLTDDGCQTACGPIMCFVAARSLGVDVSLGVMIQKCGWKQGQLTTLQRMQDTLASFGSEIVSVPARVSPEGLRKYLRSGNYVAVLPVRKGGEKVNHAICAVGFDSDKIIAIDYPELRQRYSLDELADIWDGPVLLVSHSAWGWIVRNLPWLLLPILAAMLFLVDLIFGKRRATFQSGASTPAEVGHRFFFFLGMLFCALLSVAGCENKGSSSRQLVGDNPQLGKVLAKNDGRPASHTAVVLRHDFGVVKEGEIVKHGFSIKNEGGNEVEYKQYTLSCKCLSIVDNAGTIPAKGEATITVKMDTRGLHGRVTRRADLRSTDAEVRPIVLALTGTVAGVQASPSNIDLGDLESASPASRAFLLIGTGYPDAEVKSAMSQNPAIHVTTEDVDAEAAELGNGQRAFCRVTVGWSGKGLPPGAFDTRIAVTTNVSSSIVVPVVGYVRGAVELRPARMFFGRVAARTQARRSCKLVSGQLAWAGMESLQLEADHDFVHGTFSRETGSERDQISLDVEMDVPADAKKGLIKGDLVVSTNDGEFFFCVPYVALIQ